MTDRGKGWLAVVAAFGSFLVSMSGELLTLGSWDKLSGPEFVASMVLHLGTAMGAFAAGRFFTRNE